MSGDLLGAVVLLVVAAALTVAGIVIELRIARRENRQ